MSLSAISSSLLAAAQAASTSSTSTTAKSTGSTGNTSSDLSTALSDALNSGDATSSSLYSALVTLSSQQSGASDNSTTTYDAKGMILTVKRALMENNPLYSSGSSDFSGSTNSSGSSTDLLSSLASSNTSDLNSLLDSILNTGTADTSQSSGTNTSKSGTGSSSS